jgi:hypothetical protein
MTMVTFSSSKFLCLATTTSAVMVVVYGNCEGEEEVVIEVWICR